MSNLPGRLDSSSLRIFFYDAMATVNSRSLTATGSKYMEPLTPNHLITMKGKTLTQTTLSFCERRRLCKETLGESSIPESTVLEQMEKGVPH